MIRKVSTMEFKKHNSPSIERYSSADFRQYKLQCSSDLDFDEFCLYLSVESKGLERNDFVAIALMGGNVRMMKVLWRIDIAAVVTRRDCYCAKNFDFVVALVIAAAS